MTKSETRKSFSIDALLARTTSSSSSSLSTPSSVVLSSSSSGPSLQTSPKTLSQSGVPSRNTSSSHAHQSHPLGTSVSSSSSDVKGIPQLNNGAPSASSCDGIGNSPKRDRSPVISDGRPESYIRSKSKNDTMGHTNSKEDLSGERQNSNVLESHHKAREMEEQLHRPIIKSELELLSRQQQQQQQQLHRQHHSLHQQLQQHGYLMSPHSSTSHSLSPTSPLSSPGGGNANDKPRAATSPPSSPYSVSAISSQHFSHSSQLSFPPHSLLPHVPHHNPHHPTNILRPPNPSLSDPTHTHTHTHTHSPHHHQQQQQHPIFRHDRTPADVNTSENSRRFPNRASAEQRRDRESSSDAPSDVTRAVSSSSPCHNSPCSTPRSHTPESPTSSPRPAGSVSGACTPPRGSPPSNAFVPRPGLLNLQHHPMVQAGHLGFQNMFPNHGLYNYPGGQGHVTAGPLPHPQLPSMLTGSAFHHPAEQALKLAQLQGINYAEWLARTGMYVSRMVDYPGEFPPLFLSLSLSLFLFLPAETSQETK
ncbi:putative uncharacterized protein DDB_G0291608 [Aplysia californica]|uniref:Uncharacterized protein n=1 Tax=Aplysia californica TaxID=6500 RepID=A0ABM1W2Z7_APLCA|nr:putative uncharacterized protein DDB_G0291608 [Aplysia californica]